METVEYFMEQMVPELEALQKFKLFTKVCFFSILISNIKQNIKYILERNQINH